MERRGGDGYTAANAGPDGASRHFPAVLHGVRIPAGQVLGGTPSLFSVTAARLRVYLVAGGDGVRPSYCERFVVRGFVPKSGGV